MTPERTGYEIREGAAMIAERITLPDRILVNAVTFLFQSPHEPGPSSRYDVKAMGSVDRYGHVSVDPGLPWGDRSHDLRELIAERRTDMTNALLDAGLAEWRGIGSGDTELYATQALLRHLAPALAALPRDWQNWPVDG